MSSFNETPRVNVAKLSLYQGKTVRLTAKVLSLDGDTAILEASDQGQVKVFLHREANLATQYVEIIGRVNDDLTIKVLASMNMGNNLDLSIVDKVVEYSHSSKGEGVLC